MRVHGVLTTQANAAQSTRSSGPAGQRPLSGPEATLQLQRLAGNRAVASVIAPSALVVQRGRKNTAGGKPKIADLDLDQLRIMLSGLKGHKETLQKLAKKDGALAELSLTYGLFELGWKDANRLGNIAAKDKASLEAARGLAQAIESLPVGQQAVDGSFDEKDLKKRLGKDWKLFSIVASLGKEFRRLHTKQPAGYEHQAAIGTGRVGPQDELTRRVLPTADVIAKAKGHVGETLRALTGPTFDGQAITSNEVDQIYDAYNQDSWSYDTGFSPTPHALILGHTNKGVCGALATALLEMVNLVAKDRAVPNPANLRSHQGRFVTKTYQWGYIDQTVKGNIESIEGGATGYANVNRAHFTSHTWMEAFGAVYDPLGRQKNVDFLDATIGHLKVGKDNVVSTNDDWDVVKSAAKPPAGFPQGYRLRQHQD